MKKVLITGAGGLIGSRLQQMLSAQGYVIHTIGRSGDKKNKNAFAWDIEQQQMDERALDGVSAIIHLAGAGVADKRWTEVRKKEIMSSRIASTRLLYQTLSHIAHNVQTIVSASAVGYYGDCGADIVTEKHPRADTFLAEVVKNWETEVGAFEKLSIRHVSCRIGIVLSQHGGALPELTRSMPMGVAGYPAKTPLYYPWIHIDDVCGIMIHAIENQQLQGSYNTTAPSPVLIRELMEAVIRAKKSKAILMPVPPIALKIALGEMADMLLSSQRCSDEKVIQAGYRFRFPRLNDALKDIYVG